VLVEGELTLYVERGGRTLLTFSDDDATTAAALDALGTAVRRGALGRLTVEKADGANILGPDSEPIRAALEAAGFIATSKGLRLRGEGIRA
jgi:ATP-dependent Lhr-like helicase